MRRIAILDEDGTTEIGGVRHKLVPVYALQWLNGEADEFECPPERYFKGKVPLYWWRSVFREKAAKPDLSALPEMDNAAPHPPADRATPSP